MKNLQYLIVLTTTLALTIPSTAEEQPNAQPITTLRAALNQGEALINLRYRFENVSDDAFEKDANASTLRTTLSYASAPYRGFSFFLEAEDVSTIGNDDSYNNAGTIGLNNGIRDRPVVADPEITEINQAWAQLELGGTDLRFGRQEITLSSHRFVGNVGWRQHHQTFDSVSLTNHSFNNTTLAYYFLDRVNRIFGDSKKMSSHLLHGEFKAPSHGLLSAYVYQLDFDETADAGLSTTTYGLRWDGTHNLSRAKVTYTLEAAQQQDTGDNPNAIDAGYYLLEVSAGRPALTTTFGYEILEGSLDKGSFRTPLATLHKFNGFADRFLSTPANGLVDIYGGIGGKIRNFGWKIIYHDFTADNDSIDFGSELDLLATCKTRWGQTFGFKAALYDADAHSTDTEKIMFWTAWRFGR
jgi:hypothetical protein